MEVIDATEQETASFLIAGQNLAPIIPTMQRNYQQLGGQSCRCVMLVVGSLKKWARNWWSCSILRNQGNCWNTCNFFRSLWCVADSTGGALGFCRDVNSTDSVSYFVQIPLKLSRQKSKTKSSPFLRVLYFQSWVKLCLALHIIRPHGAVCHLLQSGEKKEKGGQNYLWEI